MPTVAPSRVSLEVAIGSRPKANAVYVALGVSRDGSREVLGLWIAENEGAKFWLSVMNELKNRGLQDVLIAVVPSRQIWPCQIACRAMDGLKGFPDAITAAFPEAMAQSGASPVQGWIDPLDQSRDALH